MKDYIKEKITDGDRITSIVKQIPDEHDRDAVVAMCSGIVEGFLLATNFKREQEGRGHGV